jgi:outer membrane protein assembly factor BamB
MKHLLIVFVLGVLPVNETAEEHSTASIPSSNHSSTVGQFPKTGEWPSLRRTGTLEARSPLKGKITDPKIVWKQFAGALESHVVIGPGDTQVHLNLPEDESVSAGPADSIPIESFIPDLPVEDKNIANNEAFVAYADIFPEYPGKEKFQFESAFHKTMIDGKWPPCVGRCLAKKDGKWITIWETEPIAELFISLPLVGDFDNDGSQEIAILPFYSMVLIDARTGVVKDTCRFTDNRSYGFVGAYDFNHDGITEFLVEADFSKHVDVLGFPDGKKLSLLWTHDVEQDTFRPRKIMRVAPDPTADVDGDGQAEVITTLFDVNRDGKWHLSFLDALTGKEEFDFPDEMFSASIDVDGDGVPEILTTVTEGVNTLAKIRVRSIKEGKPRLLWGKEGATWETWEPNLPPHVKSSAILGQQTVLSQTLKGRVRAVLREELSPSQASVVLAEWNGSEFKSVTTVTGEHLSGLGLDAKGRLLVRSRHPVDRPTSLKIANGKPAQQSTKRIGLEPGPAVVAWPDGADAPTIVVQGAVDEQITFHPPKTAGEIQPCAHVSGRGQGGWYPKHLGPVIADLAGDGRRQLIVSEIGTSGCARLSVKDLDGEVIWQHEFPRIPGNHVHYNTGGLVLWQPGHFRDKKRQDILVTTQRSMLGTEETCLLSGTDGSLIWHRDKQISKRAVGGNSFAVADYDGDGLDDVASLWPSIFYLLKGSTGENILAMDTRWKQVYEKEVYFGQAVAGNFLNDGHPAVFFSGRLMTGVIRTDGTLVWFDALDTSAAHLPSLGDFNGDGKLEMVGVGFDDGIRCYDLASGEIQWRMPNPVDDVNGFGMHSENPVGGAVAADIDGDGRDEALISINNELFCLATDRNDSSGEVRWKIKFPDKIGPPTLAGLNPVGTSSILVVGSDGYVYCVR